MSQNTPVLIVLVKKILICNKSPYYVKTFLNNHLETYLGLDITPMSIVSKFEDYRMKIV